jgi:hypothetical protein
MCKGQADVSCSMFHVPKQFAGIFKVAKLVFTMFNTYQKTNTIAIKSQISAR